MIANSMCIACQVKSQEAKIRHFADEEKKSACMHEMMGILYNYGQSDCAPTLSARIQRMVNRYYGNELPGFTSEKKRYNELMLSQEAFFERKVREAEDPLLRCIQYVCAGNYIDFSAVKDVNEETLRQMLEKAVDVEIPEIEYAQFRRDLECADSLNQAGNPNRIGRLVYLVDNCGEIVLDKIFIRMLQEYYPNLSITVIVRGEEVLNDATMEDVTDIGLTEMVRCIGNGSDVPGTDLKEVSEEARQCIEQADLIISKGQGNFESMYGNGLNVWYMFLCKCELFVRRFGMKQFSTIFAREDHIRFEE